MSRGRPLWQTVSLLGVAQIISWGSLYYSLTVLSQPIRDELHFSDVTIFGAFTVGQLLSALAAPFVGRRIDRFGGRDVMSAGSFTAACALAIVAAAKEPIVFTTGWMLAGLAMAACLYIPAFATLFQLAPERYRRAVTGLTLFGGFASTVFWPLAHALASAFGWRTAFLVFAALHLVVCLPIHRLVLPAGREAPVTAIDTGSGRHFADDDRFVPLAASFAAAAFVFSALSAYMIPALGARGFSVEQAVWIGALIGPMQVVARTGEWLVARRISALSVGLASGVCALAGMALLNTVPAHLGFGAAFALCWGASVGLMTIARGTVPSVLFGPRDQGALLGALGRPSSIAMAVAPGLFAAALSSGVTMRAGISLLTVISAAGLLCFWFVSRATSQ